jgi:cobalamin biosynthesis protein CobD/CbiB
MNKILDTLGWILMYFISVAFLYFVVQIAIVMHKSALGIYKLEREIQQIHQRLEENTPVDKNEAQNGAEIG